MSGHHHHHSDNSRLLFICILLTFSFAVVEYIFGWLANSLALMSDAGHMLSDALALAIAAFAVWLQRHPPSFRHSYGLVRAEVIAALFNGLTMLLVIFAILNSAIERLNQPQEITAMTVIYIATIGLILNIVLAYILHKGEQTLNMRAALLHVAGDILGSIAALLSGLIIYLTGWSIIDPLLSLGICILIFFATYQLIKEALFIIMEAVPKHLDLEEVGLAIAAIENIHSVHDLHIWTLSSGKTVLSAHVVVTDLTNWDELLKNINSLMHITYGIDHTTIQPECNTHFIDPPQSNKLT